MYCTTIRVDTCQLCLGDRPTSHTLSRFISSIVCLSVEKLSSLAAAAAAAVVSVTSTPAIALIEL